MKTIHFKWHRGAMWHSESRETTLTIQDPAREAEEVLEHLATERKPTEGSWESWNLASWEVGTPL